MTAIHVNAHATGALRRIGARPAPRPFPDRRPGSSLMDVDHDSTACYESDQAACLQAPSRNCGIHVSR